MDELLTAFKGNLYFVKLLFRRISCPSFSLSTHYSQPWVTCHCQEITHFFLYFSTICESCNYWKLNFRSSSRDSLIYWIPHLCREFQWITLSNPIPVSFIGWVVIMGSANAPPAAYDEHFYKAKTTRKWANHKSVERTNIYWDKNLHFFWEPLTCRHNIYFIMSPIWELFVIEGHPSWDVFRFKIFTEPFLWSRHPHLGNSVGGGFPII